MPPAHGKGKDMDVIINSKNEIEEFLSGCAFFGTGGGGDVNAGRISLHKCLKEGRKIVLTDPVNIDEDGTYCNTFFMGSIAPRTPEILEEMSINGFGEEKIVYELEDILVESVKTLEDFLGKKMDGIIVAEPGGTNAACAMAAAYKLGIPVFDGDSAGRAIPEMSNGLSCIRGYEPFPAAYCDAWGNKNVTLYAADNGAMERIGKFLSQASYGVMAESAYVMKGRKLRNVFVPYSLSRCLKVGHAIKIAKKSGASVLDAVADASDGKLIGMGTISSFHPSDANGYYSGVYRIKGTGAYKDKEFKIWFKNENHILWVNEKPVISSPDLISVIDVDRGEPLLNSDIKGGENVGIIITRCCDFYKEPDSIEYFGPRYFGFDFDYLPFENVEF